MDELTSRDLQRLTDTVRDGRCVLVLGPGTAVDPTDGELLSEKLARTIAEKFLRPKDVIDPTSPYHVAQRYMDQGKPRYELVEAVARFYQQYAGQTTELHRTLAQLPFSLYLTVTHDSFMHRALNEQPNRTPQISHYCYRQAHKVGLNIPIQKNPIIYQLYGALEDDESLVLTENDMLLFLQRIVTGTPPLPSQIEGPLRDDKNAFLFLGFGFSQWYARILLYSLLGEERQLHRQNLRPSLVLEQGAFFNHPDCPTAAGFFENQFSFVFRECTPERFAAILKENLDAMVAAVKPVPEPLPEEAPLVFLSYRRLNIDKVDTLRERLQAAGIRTWQDVQNLRGGTRWAQAIERVIGKQADYFLILQTPSMVDAKESVVFDELREAQKRDKRRNPDDATSFIIPAILEPCSGLGSLADLHRIDLTEESGTEQLIQIIKDDWEQRSGGRHVA